MSGYVESLQDLFKTVKPEVILDFLKAAALYKALQLYAVQLRGACRHGVKARLFTSLHFNQVESLNMRSRVSLKGEDLCG